MYPPKLTLGPSGALGRFRSLRDDSGDYAKLQEGLLCPGALNKPDLDNEHICPDTATLA